jgi:Ca2+/Na+ antiporter
VGTSHPELATAIAAARRGETDLVLGNIIGSNLFNSLAVAGVAGLVGPGVVAAGFRDALGFMVGAGSPEQVVDVNRSHSAGAHKSNSHLRHGWRPEKTARGLRGSRW